MKEMKKDNLKQISGGQDKPIDSRISDVQGPGCPVCGSPNTVLCWDNWGELSENYCRDCGHWYSL